MEVIIAALIAGAAAAAKDTVSDAIKESYGGLKNLIKKKFADNPKAQNVLKEYEEDPETYEKPIQKQLEQLDANSLEKIKQSAEEVLTKLQEEDKEGLATGKYGIKVQGDIKGIVGDVSGGEIHQTIS